MKYQPSASDRAEFARKMNELESFLKDHLEVSASQSRDSFYFNATDGRSVRVSNHSVEASNDAAWDGRTGDFKREKYHTDGRDTETIYINASKVRFVEIYNAIMAGKNVDGRGRIKD